ncbi:LuxR family transcriptional regulator [Amycolatopsis sp. 195334CR]|uniref:helix-turn-helix transcriptional regulator n=1 Tax=Amycolatopsis sp. 195334CR TaxID=2814588 RepID=UPI001A8D938A|nr:LuxR family transcriptional regulator [Amycolatopsis sp. 195334CR]MBN6039395.1 LuxR family transcriptional regulator [Amycolatopsis sp. 195334CR]
MTGPVGRAHELAVLGGLLTTGGGAVRVTGAPGIGKTRLLDHAAVTGLRHFGTRASPAEQLGTTASPAGRPRKLGAAGVPAERSLRFGALHRFLHPLTDLPEELRFAAGRGGAEPEEFALCAALHRLLAELGPVLCWADDTQWWDQPSLKAMAFAARRLTGLPVVMVFATGPPASPGPDPLDGLPTLRLSPLDDHAAASLLPPDLPPDERARLLTRAAGNPRDLLELAASGTETLPDDGHQRAAYRRVLAGLSAAARRFVLLAAAETPLSQAEFDRCGVLARDEALASGLLASPAVRATLREDAAPAMATALAEAALRAGVTEEAVHAFERAAELGEDGPQWLIPAARGAWELGRTTWARQLLRRAGDRLLQGEIELRDGEPAVAAHELLTAAETLPPAETSVALMLAGEARRISGDLRGFAAIAARTAQLARDSGVPEVRLAAAHTRGLAATFAGRHEEAIPALEEALRVAPGDVRSQVWAAEAALALGRTALAHEYAAAAVARARIGAVTTLPWALIHLGMSAALLDRHRAAVAAATEGLAESTGQRTCAAENMTVLALSAARLGDTKAARKWLDEADLDRRSLGRPRAIAAWAEVCVDLATDRPADALARFRTLSADTGYAQPAIAVLATPLLVEAAVRCEEPEEAVRGLRVLDGWAEATGSVQWRALAQRCHGLLARDPDAADKHFTTAVDLHRLARTPLELAKTQLCQAMRLRRDRRFRDARELLGDAARLFDRHGAEFWAGRARAELRAAGGDPAEPADGDLPSLTPQQAQISLLVAGGKTNREIARRLVISHRTVDHHLRNIYTKLGVRSRVELAALLARRATAPPGDGTVRFS